MIKKLLSNVNFYVVIGMNVVYASDMIKKRMTALAETETVYSPREYVMVRLARGDYNNLDGWKTIKNDYKFYNIISSFNEE